MNLHRFFCLVLSLACILPLCGQEIASKSAASDFFAALKAGNIEAVQSLVYQLPGQQPRITARLTRLVQRAQAAGAVPVVSDAKEIATIAMAIVKDTAKRPDGKADYDAVLLLNRNGKWLVVMSIAEVEDNAGILRGDERKQLVMLREWQDTRMRQLAEQAEAPKENK
jgi:hypothetical protein